MNNGKGSGKTEANDPFWTDGVNLNLVRNHIIYGRRLCEEELQEGDYPEEYYLPLPEKVPPNYMVKGDEIRRKASELMRNIKENPDYIGLFGKSEKSQKEAEIIKYISGIARVFQKMILLQCEDLYIGIFQE